MSNNSNSNASTFLHSTAPIPWNFHSTDMMDQCNYASPLFISRINKIPPSNFYRIYLLGTIFGLGIILYVTAFALVIIRRNKSPLRDRSVSLLLISGISGALGLAYMYSRLYFDLILVCPITYYMVGLVQFSYFLPYLFRCFRTIMQYKLAQAQAAIMEEQEISAEEDNIHVRDLNSYYYRMESMESGNRSRRRRRRNRDIRDNTFLASDNSNDLNIVERPLNYDFLSSKKRITQGNMISELAKNEKYSRLISSQYYFSEGFLLIVMTIILIVWAMIIFMAHMILMFGFSFINPVCQKRCNEDEGMALRVFVCVTIILIIPFAFLLFKMRKVNDDFSIRKEMMVMLFFSIIVVAIPLIVLLALPGQFWPDQPTIGYFLGIEVVGSFIISIIYPLSSTWVRDIDLSNIFKRWKQGVKKNSDHMHISTANMSLNQPLDSTLAENAIPFYEKFEFYLQNNDAREVFKQFLVRELHVESLMFVTEVQYFKSLDQEDELLGEIAKTLFATYVRDGAPFEVHISHKVRNELINNLERPSLDIFNKAEHEVLKVMETQSFSRFKKSNLFSTFTERFKKK
ncbi:hypothetical protein FDP41_008721 [Naegleria fowleri]|uniref:RGS domain-containing protein n=1 Tax=Naegleria fowleri TaxID=5763 RepID=A0A6A5B5A5_NAEFO|nr:uncharacterized protein FDP41_008721 [Naegleria fowleri]KAF0973057.1 hypothetical protein FDP41_008721 [Naegleria fowleri]CAG4709307.1 unnamed protein product [Naegleria fowleri]